MKKKIYLGVRQNVREVFRSAVVPTDQTHGKLYDYTIGPFRTVRGATYMKEYGVSNPHVVTVADAERIARTRINHGSDMKRWQDNPALGNDGV